MDWAKSFSRFINEAYVDSDGQLRDFRFTPDEEFELGIFDNIQDIKVFLEDQGAYGVKHSVDGSKVYFYFQVDLTRYSIILDLENSFAMLQKERKAPTRVETLYAGDLRDFTEILAVDGLKSMIGDQDDQEL